MIEVRKLKLNKSQAVFLVVSCIAQLFIFCINVGTYDLYKYVLFAISFFSTILALYNIWINTFLDNKLNSLLKSLFFIFIFNFIIILSSKYLGGFIAFLIGILYLKLFIKIKY